MSTWTQQQALQACRELEPIIAPMGMHVGLTGGCLYKDGARKDMDVILYRHHGAELATFDQFCATLAAERIAVIAVHHNVVKCQWQRWPVLQGSLGGVDFILRAVSWPETEACPEGSSDSPKAGTDPDLARDEAIEQLRVDAMFAPLEDLGL